VRNNTDLKQAADESGSVCCQLSVARCYNKNAINNQKLPNREWILLFVLKQTQTGLTGLIGYY